MWSLIIAIPLLLFALWFYFLGLNAVEGDADFKNLVYGFFFAYAIAAGLMIWFMPKPNAPADFGGLWQSITQISPLSP